MFLRVCSKIQLWVYHERSKKEKLKSFILAFATEYWEWSIWSPFEQTDFFSVRHAVVRFISPNPCPTEKEWFVKPISCDVKKSSRERLSLVFGYTASIWFKTDATGTKEQCEQGSPAARALELVQMRWAVQTLGFLPCDSLTVRSCLWLWIANYR